jgi:hypothetical protein
MIDPKKWERIRAGIFAGESQGDYDALYGYANRPNGPFENVKLRQMTVDQALDFARPDGEYAKWVKNQLGYVATPMGAFQTVGTTLGDAKKGLGLTGNEMMDEGLQNKIGQYIYSKQGTGAWEGYKGEMDVPEIIEERDMNGNLTPDFMRRMAGGAIDRATQPPMTSYKGPMASAMAESDPSAMNFMDPYSSSEPVSYDNTGLLGKLLPDRTDRDRRKMLLAIGSGLLSGDDWASGGAAAGQNVLSLEMQKDARKDQLQDSQTDFDRKRQLMQEELAARAAMNQANPTQFERVGSVVMPQTNEIVGGVSYDPNSGEYFTQNADGSRRVLRGAIPLNNSTAAGDKLMTAGEMAKQQDSIKEAQSGLRSFDNVISHLDDINYGAAGFIDELKLNLKSLFGSSSMTDEEIARRVQKGELQGLIGKARKDVVGGGVMSEQDAARVALALGGDFSSIFQNPEVSRQLLQTRRDSMFKDYMLTHDQYDAGRQIPGSPWIAIPRYGSEAPMDQSKGTPASTPALTQAPPKSFEGTAAEWAALDPEDQAIWLDEETSTDTSSKSDFGALSLKGIAQEALMASGLSPEEWALLGASGQEEIIKQYLSTKK